MHANSCDRWRENLPLTVEAWFVVAGQPSGGQFDSSQIRRKYEVFVQTFSSRMSTGSKEADALSDVRKSIPLLTFHPGLWHPGPFTEDEAR